MRTFEPPPRSVRRPRTVAVVGAGLTGLTAALLLARDGHRVTVLDRDPAPPPAQAPTPRADAEAAWEEWQRPGVSQFRQPHLMLPRWRHEIERELPELCADLLAHGAVRVNLLHLQPDAATHGWQPGDEQFDTVTARRPVLEAALARLAQSQPGLTVRRGARVTGLVVDHGPGRPRVRGVRTADGRVPADLVVDAAGRRTPLPAWVSGLGGLGGTTPVEERDPCGFVYYSRYFRAHGASPRGHGPVLTHHPSLSVLTLPCDHDVFCVVLVAAANDRALRPLRDPAAWTAVARCAPTSAAWIAAGEPITDVLPLAGLADVRRSYVRDGVPVATGIVAVGDSAAATNPSLGRGAAIGAIHACTLRDTLAAASDDPEELVTAFAEATDLRVSPWVAATTRFDRHRLGELTADVAGAPYLTEDPTWAVTTALLAGAAEDALLARAAARIAGLLAAPPEALADPVVAARLGPYIGGRRYPVAGPTRADLLAAVTGLPRGSGLVG
ncbi:NAD(P)/FAD-dependent oxidoreductase [Nocardioides sambongensis]|uniref:NAD(P)/FAD-dependent oxidoreductase n=1 Tax=Nocardioides sambongensis TaxID=2589074 RepID=UPI0011278D2C|nr:FAD-dependent oxidoreductase [Nocardioides sambongensis]